MEKKEFEIESSMTPEQGWKMRAIGSVESLPIVALVFVAVAAILALAMVAMMAINA